MNINRYALCKERSLQKIISKQPKPNTTAIGVCSETQVTHHIITKRSDECLPISAYVPKHKEGDGKKFPVIIDIYGGDFVAGRSALNRNFGTWCAEHGYLTFMQVVYPAVGIESYDTIRTKSLDTFVLSPVRHQEEVEHFLEENCQWYGRGHRHSIPFKVIVSVSSGRKVLWENPLFGK